MAIFYRLKSLGEERFSVVLNMLMRGEPAMAVARQIQQAPPNGWGLCGGVAEKTLTQQLSRLRQQAAEGAFGRKVAKQIEAGAKPQIKLLERVSLPVIQRLEEMSDIQRNRILMMVEKETELRSALSATDDVMEGYRKILLDIQKIRFDLGLDEFKGPMAMTAGMRGASQTTTLPDGTSVHKQVFETLTHIEQIFDAREIPRLSR